MVCRHLKSDPARLTVTLNEKINRLVEETPFPEQCRRRR